MSVVDAFMNWEDVVKLEPIARLMPHSIITPGNRDNGQNESAIAELIDNSTCFYVKTIEVTIFENGPTLRQNAIAPFI